MLESTPNSFSPKATERKLKEKMSIVLTIFFEEDESPFPMLGALIRSKFDQIVNSSNFTKEELDYINQKIEENSIK